VTQLLFAYDDAFLKFYCKIAMWLTKLNWTS